MKRSSCRRRARRSRAARNTRLRRRSIGASNTICIPGTATLLIGEGPRMELQHPRPPEPPVKVPPNEDIPDPLEDPTRGTPDYLPPDSPPLPERDPGTPVEKRE